MWVICADSDEEAQRLAASGRMTFTLLRRGQLIAVPPPEEALPSSQADDRVADGQPSSRRRAIVGAPATVRPQLEEVVASYGAEEAIVVCITYEHEARRRSTSCWRAPSGRTSAARAKRPASSGLPAMWSDAPAAAKRPWGPHERRLADGAQGQRARHRAAGGDARSGVPR